MELFFPLGAAAAQTSMTISDKVIEVLKSVSETDEVQKNLDLPLYDLQILDSLKTVRLIVAISQEFGIDIPPSEFERDRWATPRKIVADIENKIGI
jgi:D-alanine--poly(phosphoribitol) ligase subunit 2